MRGTVDELFAVKSRAWRALEAAGRSVASAAVAAVTILGLAALVLVSLIVETRRRADAASRRRRGARP